MTSPFNQLPSYDSGTMVLANSSYCLPMGHTPAEIKHNQVDDKKEYNGKGSKKFSLSCTVATEALKPGFGAANFFQWSNSG